jgi:periplasmic copper chaperone A
MFIKRLEILFLILAALASPAVQAEPSAPGVVIQGVVIQGVIVKDVWTFAPPPGGRTAALYATIVNTASEDDTLLSATTAAAEVSELHTMTLNDDGVMRMRHAATLPVPAESVMQLAPGGNHVMLMGLRPKVYGKPGDSFPVRLVFQQAGSKTVTVQVRSRIADGQTPSRTTVMRDPPQREAENFQKE